MAIFRNKLFVVERKNVVEIDLESGQISNRYAVPQPMFLNDIAIDKSGSLYVSDSSKSAIYKLTGEKCEVWLQGEEIQNPNGLRIFQGQLIIGNNGDRSLKTVDLETKEVKTLATLGPGIIDGICIDQDGNYLVSHYQGRVFRITPAGQITKLLDTTGPGLRCADFEYITARNLFIIPGLEGNQIIAYQSGGH
ncbi:SMP-30/gluconolactonase/LRE family protein [candidate division CSSED10-310 bacterium]|uniref:SMP-30/gluconolactonase/LRE family protein n=1 Tax=candidate division CSSED10-310 bacterium TaxID=2855610 RepID=A0ABV6Z1H8_UNCC1